MLEPVSKTHLWSENAVIGNLLIQRLLSVTTAYSIKFVSNQQIGQKKSLRSSLFLTLQLLSLNWAFTWLPVTGRSAYNQVGALLADFRFVESSHLNCLDMLYNYNNMVTQLKRITADTVDIFA
jgi:hypothetical protein